MSDLWTLGVPVGEKVVRTVLVYGGVAVLLRVAGKRNLAQLNSFDLVVVLLLSNVVQNAIIGPDDSLTGGLLGAVVLLGVNSLVVRIVNRSDLAVRVFEGEDIPLVKDGRFVDRSLRKEGLRRADVEAALPARTWLRSALVWRPSSVHSAARQPDSADSAAYQTQSLPSRVAVRDQWRLS